MTFYVFIFNDNGTLKTDLLTSENFDLKTVNNSEIFVINYKKFYAHKIYHFIDTYIDNNYIDLAQYNLLDILDHNNNPIDWNVLLDTIYENHGMDVINDDVKLIIVNKI